MAKSWRIKAAAEAGHEAEGAADVGPAAVSRSEVEGVAHPVAATEDRKAVVVCSAVVAVDTKGEVERAVDQRVVAEVFNEMRDHTVAVADVTTPARKVVAVKLKTVIARQIAAETRKTAAAIPAGAAMPRERMARQALRAIVPVTWSQRIPEENPKRIAARRIGEATRPKAARQQTAARRHSMGAFHVAMAARPPAATEDAAETRHAATVQRIAATDRPAVMVRRIAIAAMAAASAGLI